MFPQTLHYGTADTSLLTTMCDPGLLQQ